ncbi:MAG: hypothetical protein U0871_21360 [Gemmataceae bacterium]
MTSATRPVRSPAAFGRRWGLPILFGAAGGLLYIVLTMDALGDRFGAVAGGVLASLAGIGLGLLVSVFAALLGGLTGRARVTEPGAAADAAA